MAKTKSSDSAHTRVKVFDSTNEISQGIEKLRSRIVQVEELKKDGLPYRDALKVTTEYQIRDAIREVFGAHSPEFHEHQHHRIKVNSKAGVDDTIALLQNLVLALEEKRLHLLGFRPRQAAVVATVGTPEGNGHDAAASDAPPHPQPPPQTAKTIPAPAAPVPTEVEAPVPAPAPPPPTPVVAQHNPPPPAPHEAERAPTPHPSHSHHTRKGRSSGESRMKETPVPPPVIPQPVVAPPIATVSTEIAPQPILAPPPPQPQVVSPVPVSAPPPVAPPPAPGPVAQETTDAIHVKDQMPVQQHTEMNVEVTMAPTPAPPSEHPRADMDTVTLIQRICTRFHSVARQLRQRSDDRSTLEVEDEVDVQDVLRAVLCTQFDDIHTETWNPAYANGIPRADLVLKQDGIVIVAKKTKQGVGAKTLTEQLGVDIQRYMNHSLCKTLVCFIYDPEGRIGNPDAFEASLVRQRSARRIEVIISPR